MDSTTDASDKHLESYLTLGLTVSQSKRGDTKFPKVLSLLAAYLGRAVQKTEELLDSNKRKESPTIFHGQRVPDLSIQLYAERIFKFFNNAFYARVGGISTIEMNRLELDLLFNLDFRLKVNLETFGSYCLQLEKQAATFAPEQLPVQIYRVNGSKDLSYNGSADDFCQSELVRQRYNSQALQRCS
ncbi:hypothetical protein BRADI_2g26090v3 [Brachypodium distachyon]|uniref:Cyclin n=1 Tax=Brachypodium distachyon TaxID=15368 RepID=A0A0Q3G7E3_BRADI|nr:hypothetical protein BRADI_2g26090v3 [Brachypodium distachyon]